MFSCIDIQAQTLIINSGNVPNLNLVISDIAVFRMCTVPLPFLAVSLAWINVNFLAVYRQQRNQKNEKTWKRICQNFGLIIQNLLSINVFCDSVLMKRWL